MLELLAIPVMAVLNRYAGYSRHKLPDAIGFVHGRIPAAIGLALLALYVNWKADWLMPAVLSISWAGAYLGWRAPAWGRWLALGRLERGWNRVGIEPNWYEKAIEKVGGKNDHICLLIRFAIVSPALWFLAGPIWAAAFPFAMLACYELASQLYDRRILKDEMVTVAEPLGGAIWGAMLVLS